MEQLNVGTNDLPSVAKKVTAAVVSVSSIEPLSTVGLAVQQEQEVPTTTATNIRG
jgi:hypothetical protein